MSSQVLHKDIIKLLSHLSSQEKIIIGDPDYVPLGNYTKEALINLGLFNDLKSRFIKAHSARQASLLLKSGAGAWAILYQSDALNERFPLRDKI